MSIRVVSWALNDAPVEEPVLVLVLVAMAERANDDGTATYQSVETIASKARVSPRTCHRKLRELESMGLIRRGNQDFTAHLKAGYRPVVYDLAVHLNRGANLAPLQLAGVPNTDLRGAKSGTSGVPPLADKSSMNRPSDSSMLFQQATPVVKAKKNKTSAPDKFTISAEMKEWALANVPAVVHELDYQTTRFLDNARSNGRTYVDWLAAWRNWMRQAVEFKAQGARGAAVHLPTAQAMQNGGRRLGIDYSAPETDDGYTASTSTR